MEINRPDVLASLQAAFERYERALVSNDLAVLDELFWDSPHTTRFGAAETLHGIAAIRAFRVGRDAVDLARDLVTVVLTTFGEDFGTAAATYKRRGSGQLGRQLQAWVRLPDGWRVVAASVGPMPSAGG